MVITKQVLKSFRAYCHRRGMVPTDREMARALTFAAKAQGESYFSTCEHDPKTGGCLPKGETGTSSSGSDSGAASSQIEQIQFEGKPAFAVGDNIFFDKDKAEKFVEQQSGESSTGANKGRSEALSHLSAAGKKGLSIKELSKKMKISEDEAVGHLREMIQSGEVTSHVSRGVVRYRANATPEETKPSPATSAAPSEPVEHQESEKPKAPTSSPQSRLSLSNTIKDKLKDQGGIDLGELRREYPDMSNKDFEEAVFDVWRGDRENLTVVPVSDSSFFTEWEHANLPRTSSGNAVYGYMYPSGEAGQEIQTRIHRRKRGKPNSSLPDGPRNDLD